MNQKFTRFATSAFLALLAATPPLLAREQCATLNLETHPKWISTVELNPASGELLISDPKNRSLLAFDTKTNRMSEVKLESDIPPASITKIQGGFLVKYRDNASILGLDKKPIMTTNLRNTKAGGPTGLGSLYSNWTTKGSTFLGYGSVVRADLTSQEYNPSRGFQLGFLRGTVTASSGQFRDVELLEPTEENSLYVFGFPLFAANDDGMFYVRMIGEEASIVRVKDNATGERALERLSAFPEQYSKVPKLKTENVGPSSTAARYAEIEKSTMAVGLFGQGKFLYLLTRRPEAGATEWSLFQIDPKKPKAIGEVRLPTSAHHLSVVPGPDYWYLIERGEVKGWGDQQIDTVVRIPRVWITEPATSPLNASSPAVRACLKSGPLTH